MRAVVQRVSEAAVVVDGTEVGAIACGLVVLVGVEHGDDERDAAVLAAKIANLRVFPAPTGHFERSLLEVEGAALVVSQFTLPADVRKGRRPSFSAAAGPAEAEPLVHAVVGALQDLGVATETGRFGAMMSVSLVNEGPATFLLRVSEGKVV